MIDLHQFDEDCSKEKTRPILKKRYKKNGEEYLEVVDEIDIEEDLKEKKLEIERILEIVNTQERVRTEELLNQMTMEEVNELENLTQLKDIDTYEFLNKTNELKEIYNKMPNNIRVQYNNLADFGKEYLPKFINEQKERLNKEKELEIEMQKQNEKQKTFEELQDQIKVLQEQINNKGVTTND